LFAEKIGEKIDAECIYGTSLGTGIETETGVNEVALAYGEGIADMTYTDLSNVVNQLTGNKLGGAEWVVPKAFTHYARLLQDGAGAYAWGSMKASDPPGIFGYPVAVVDQFPTDTGDNILAVFGNWKHVLLGRRKGDMTLDLDPYGRFTYYQMRSRMITRWAMAVGLPAGLVRLMSGAATTTTT
jgi:HK97 family phage major capsid protein